MTKVQFRILYREFLFRMFDVEMLSAHARGNAGVLLGQFATLLVCLSILFVSPVLAFDGKISGPLFLLGSWSSQHFLIATTMVIVGLFAVLNWNATFPDKHDILVLAPLPVRSRTIFMAKIAAVGTSLAIAVLVLHILAGMVWPFVFNKKMPAQSVPAFTSDRAIDPVGAADMRSVLDRDIAPMLRNGGLAPGTRGGVAIGVYKQGVRRIITYGTASPNSMFEIGSLTKTFTGLLLAKMAEQKKVTLQEPVRLLLPENVVTKPPGDEIRLLDLATHRSGLPSMPNNLPAGNVAEKFTDYHLPDLYAYISSHGVHIQQNVPFEYSNLGFSILGQALANGAGVSYPELLRQEVTAPLGLNNTVVKLSPEQQTRFIQGHDEKHGAVQPWDLDAFVSAGGIRSTAGDMLTYLVANLHPDKLASADSALRAALSESHKLRADAAPGTRIALAWFYDLDNETYSHSGATGGYSSYAFFNPKGDYAGIVLLNNGPSLLSNCALLGEHLRQRLAGAAAFSLANVSVPATGGLRGLIRSFAVYWITMFFAGGFIFCCVLGLQGLAAQLPRRYFLRISSFLQFAVFCLLMSVYFLQPSFATPASLIEAQGNGLLSWSPSFWFLGLYQQLSGSPALALLAHRAWAGLAIAVSGTGLAYTLSYFRTLRKIVEEPDILPGARGFRWLPRFGDSLETAVVRFSIRTLLRSRQHRLIFACYAGIAFAIASFLLKSASVRELSDVTISNTWRQVSMPLLASTILAMAFAVVGLRVVFSLPMDLPANWIFRITPFQSGPQSVSAYRRSLWMLAVVPVWMGSSVLLLSIWPWQAASGHLVILGLLGTALVELCLQGNQKIPFTCSWLLGKSNFHITSILCANLVFLVVAATANLERAALQNPTHTFIAIGIVAFVAAISRWRTWLITRSEILPLRFEESPSWQLVTLNLPRDGGMPAN